MPNSPKVTQINKNFYWNFQEHFSEDESDAETKFELKKKLLDETTNSLLFTPYLQAKSQDYGVPMTSKVILKAKDPLNYSKDKKIAELSPGRWSPIKLKLMKQNNSVFDVS